MPSVRQNLSAEQNDTEINASGLIMMRSRHSLPIDATLMSRTMREGHFRAAAPPATDSPEEQLVLKGGWQKCHRDPDFA